MYRILVAEDNNINVKVAEFTLKPISSKLDFAKNGEEALKMLEEDTYDVVLMDVKMPVMDGYEATKRIREQEKEKQVEKPLSIIAITANNQPEEVKHCISIGMNDFLSKPFTTDQAKDVIESSLK